MTFSRKTLSQIGDGFRIDLWARKLVEAYAIILDRQRFVDAGQKIANAGSATMPEIKRFYDPVQSFRAVTIPLQISAVILGAFLVANGNIVASAIYAVSVFIFHYSGIRWSLLTLCAVEEDRFDDIRSTLRLYSQGAIFSICIDFIFISFAMVSKPEMLMMYFASWGFAIVVLNASYYFNFTFAITMTIVNLAFLTATAFFMARSDPLLANILAPSNFAFPIGVIVVCAANLRTMMTIHYRTGLENQMSLNRANMKVIETLDDVSRLNTQMARIANSSEHGIALVDADGTIGLMNERFRHIFGIKNGSERQDAHAVIPSEIIDNSQPQFSYTRGDEKVFLVSNVTIADRGGMNSKLLLLTDITERTREERERVQLDRLGILGTLSSGIAHDFNNLLTIIQNQVDGIQLRNPHLDEDVAIGDIHHAIASSSALARQLLSYTHEMPLSRERVVLKDLVARTIDLAKPALGKNISVSFTAKSDDLVNLDTYILEVNLLNLIINARDAMDGEGEISILLERVGDFVEIRVTDVGKGIAPDKMDKVFLPFFSTKGNKGNAGLGLALAKSFVEKSGGKIGIESTLGKGTTVIISLPIAQEPDGFSVPQVLDNQNATGDHWVRPAHIMVIDDKEPLVRSQVRLLSNWYERVDGVGSIAELIARGPLGQYDLILCDLVLQNETGVDVLRLFRSMGIKTPILYFSGNIPPEMRDELNAIEPSIIMEKPVDMQRMVEEIDRALRIDEVLQH